MHRCVFRDRHTSINLRNIVAPALKVGVLAAFLFLTPMSASAQGILGGLLGVLQQLQQLLNSQEGLSSDPLVN